MFDFLEGRVAEHSAARLVLDVHGVGYELLVPLGASFTRGETLLVWTHLVVREDAWLLFGFREPETREVFRALLTVGGVGPKIAMSILSGIARDELVDAIAAGDVARLTNIRGVGRKTAEQILLDLRDKVVVLQRGAPESAQAPRGARDRRRQLEDAVTALISIGYGEKDARKQVERAAREVDPSDLERLVRAALQG